MISNMLTKIDDLVWGIPLIVLILAVGIFLTVRLRGVQFSKLGLAIKYIMQNDKSGKEGEVSSFGALCTALSATIGTGNIVGVATALVAGGPGALFWMWLAALFGTATKFAECMLAMKYRTVASDGHILGGPFYYIENGMGKNWRWLGKIFAFFGVCVGLMGIGTFTQVNGITSAVNNFFDPSNAWAANLFGREYSWTVVAAGILLTLCVGLVIIGGLKRISRVAEIIVPFMAILYVAASFLVIVCNITKVPAAIVEIVQSAFGFRAAAAAKTDEPVHQGLVSMMGTYIDTIVICTLTGLTIVITGSWNVGLEGVAVTTRAFQEGLPFPDQIASFILMICLVFFAFTTILGWDYYSERCLEYLTNGNMKAVKVYRWIYILAVFIGPYMTVAAVWTIADIFNGLMAIPNLIALVALSGVTAAEVKKYFANGKE